MALSGVALADLVTTALEQFRDNIADAYTDPTACKDTLEAVNVLIANRTKISKTEMTEFEFESMGRIQADLVQRNIAFNGGSARRSFVRGVPRLL